MFSASESKEREASDNADKIALKDQRRKLEDETFGMFMNFSGIIKRPSRRIFFLRCVDEEVHAIFFIDRCA
jgi:hypothetical protein